MTRRTRRPTESGSKLFWPELQRYTHDETGQFLGPGRTKQCRIAMNDEIIIAIAHTNQVPYGDPESFTTHDSRDTFFTYTYIARVLENPFGPVAVKGWELY